MVSYHIGSVIVNNLHYFEIVKALATHRHYWPGGRGAGRIAAVLDAQPQGVRGSARRSPVRSAGRHPDRVRGDGSALRRTRPHQCRRADAGTRSGQGTRNRPAGDLGRPLSGRDLRSEGGRRTHRAAPGAVRRVHEFELEDHGRTGLERPGRRRAGRHIGSCEPTSRPSAASRATNSQRLLSLPDRSGAGRPESRVDGARTRRVRERFPCPASPPPPDARRRRECGRGRGCPRG